MELPLEAFGRAIQCKPLPGVQRAIRNGLPQACHGENRCQSRSCTIDGATKAHTEPFHPRCALLRRFLRSLQDVTVAGAHSRSLGAPSYSESLRLRVEPSSRK